MICAIFVIALPTSVIGSNFMTEWQLYNQSVLQKKVKDKVEKSAAALKVADFISLKELDNNIKEQNEKYFKTVATLQDLVNEVNHFRSNK